MLEKATLKVQESRHVLEKVTLKVRESRHVLEKVTRCWKVEPIGDVEAS